MMAIEPSIGADAHRSNLSQAGMRAALDAARIAASRGDVPIGAAIAVGTEVIGARHNCRYSRGSQSDHAEVRVLRSYARQLQKAQAEQVPITLFTTLEPCWMCMGAAALHRVKTIVFALADPLGGAGCQKHILNKWYASRWPRVVMGPLRAESRDLLLRFCASRTDWTALGVALRDQDRQAA